MTAWPTGAASAAVSRLSMVVWKNAGEASSKVGEFVRLTTTAVPSSASDRPRPLSRSKPVDGECGTASWPRALRTLTTCDPISPVPPMTAIFMFFDLLPHAGYDGAVRLSSRSTFGFRADYPPVERSHLRPERFGRGVSVRFEQQLTAVRIVGRDDRERRRPRTDLPGDAAGGAGGTGWNAYLVRRRVPGVAHA